MAVSAPEGLTIDELAREAGMTVRNVRAYRSRGLIPAPELRGRKGYYGTEHLARLELIAELKDRGFSLDAIAHVVERAPEDSLNEALDFTRAVLAPLGDEEPEIVSSAEFLRRWGDQLTPEVVRRAQQLGFVRRVGDDEWEVRSPRLGRASQALSELGVPLDDAIGIGLVLRRHARAIARAYVELFVGNVWRPFEQAGCPKEDWPEVKDALARLQPLADESLLAVFRIAMGEAVEEAMDDDLAALRERDEA